MKLGKLSTLWSKAWNIALFFCGTWPTVNVNLWGAVASASRHQWPSPRSCKKPPSESLCLPRSLLITALPLVYLYLLTYFSPWFDSVLWILSGQTHYNDPRVISVSISTQKVSLCSYLKLLDFWFGKSYYFTLYIGSHDKSCNGIPAELRLVFADLSITQWNNCSLLIVT